MLMVWHAGSDWGELELIARLASLMMLQLHQHLAGLNDTWWEFVLKAISHVLKLSLLSAPVTSQQTNFPACTGGSLAEEEARAACISTLAVMAARMCAKQTVPSMQILPSKTSFQLDVFMLLSDALDAHHAHKFGGILAIQLARCYQFLPDPARNDLSKPAMSGAISSGG